MFLAEHIVVDIVSRSHFQATRTELNIDIVILNHRDFTANERHNHTFALQMGVFRVVGIDTHRRVAHNRFRTCCGNNCIAVLTHDFITQVVELAMLFLVDHLLVAESSLRRRIPIDHTHATVNQAFVEKVDKHVEHTLRAHLVHRKRRAAPVARSAKFLQLLKDDAAMLLFPFPRMFKKLIACKVGLLYTFRSKTRHHLRLRCNRRMVGSRHPESVLALHPRAADKDVLDCIVEHVSHMEHSSDIWRRDNDCIRLPAVGSRLKQVVFQPIFVPFSLYFLRAVLRR